MRGSKLKLFKSCRDTLRSSICTSSWSKTGWRASFSLSYVNLSVEARVRPETVPLNVPYFLMSLSL